MNLTKELGLTPEEAREEREQTADTHRAFQFERNAIRVRLLRSIVTRGLSVDSRTIEDCAGAIWGARLGARFNARKKDLMHLSKLGLGKFLAPTARSFMRRNMWEKERTR